MRLAPQETPLQLWAERADDGWGALNGWGGFLSIAGGFGLGIASDSGAAETWHFIALIALCVATVCSTIMRHRLTVPLMSTLSDAACDGYSESSKVAIARRKIDKLDKNHKPRELAEEIWSQIRMTFVHAYRNSSRLSDEEDNTLLKRLELIDQLAEEERVMKARLRQRSIDTHDIEKVEQWLGSHKELA